VIHTREHLIVHQARELRPATLLELLERVDAARRPERFELLLRACLCDARGRTGFEECDYPQVPYLREAARVMLEVQAGDLADAGLGGEAIGAELRKRRTAGLKQWIEERRMTAGSSGQHQEG
jgi:tRNA nucleotidyltransferase (CCA-adding enzyme)